MAVALLDTSAVVGYLDPEDVFHASAAAAIEPVMSSGISFALSAVTWSELLQGALLGYYAEEILRAFVRAFGIELLAVDAAVAERAAALQKAYRDTGSRSSRPKLRTADALILATSERYEDVSMIIAGDGQWRNVPGVAAELVLLRAMRG